ncbi:MAG: putative integral rane protein [Thermoleophilia bacterium]|nr:putative integral rane protein [Thermoleophilia bacterium]
MDSALLTWIVIAALFAVAEIATTAFVSLYLALGALAAALVAGLGGSVGWQIAAFVLVGLVLMALTRPLIKKRLEVPDVLMNVDKVIGKTGIVTIPVDNDANTGQVRVGTEFWTARRPEDATDGGALTTGSRVRVISVEGVTARVEPIAAREIADPAGPTT